MYQYYEIGFAYYIYTKIVLLTEVIIFFANKYFSLNE